MVRRRTLFSSQPLRLSSASADSSNPCEHTKLTVTGTAHWAQHWPIAMQAKHPSDRAATLSMLRYSKSERTEKFCRGLGAFRGPGPAAWTCFCSAGVRPSALAICAAERPAAVVAFGTYSMAWAHHGAIAAMQACDCPLGRMACDPIHLRTEPISLGKGEVHP